MENIRDHIYLAALLKNLEQFYLNAFKFLTKEERKQFNSSPNIPKGDIDMKQEECYNEWAESFIAYFFKSSYSSDKVIELIRNKKNSGIQENLILSTAATWSLGVSNLQTTNNENHSSSLLSIFNHINNGKGNKHFPLKKLSLDLDSCFPLDEKEKFEEGQYAVLWRQFVKECKQLPADSFHSFSESFLYLLKKYTWAVPISNNQNSISLYEHLKITAAFSDCFYLFNEEDPISYTTKENNQLLYNDVEPVLLIGGDLSGIQSFIYNIASRKAAVSLKGRSFYLQLLLDAIIQRILSHESINARSCQIIYSSGGKFYLLLPNTNKVKEALESLRIEFENEIWNEHKGQLFFNLQHLPFTFSTQTKDYRFEGKTSQNIGSLWGMLANKLAENKSSKFKSIIQTEFDALFSPTSIYDPNNKKQVRICAVTGIESTNCVKIDDKEKTPTYVLPQVKNQIYIGNTLKDVDYIFSHTSKTDLLSFKSRSKCNVELVGIENYLFDQKELTHDDADFRKAPSKNVTLLKRINNLEFLAAQLKGQKVGYGFQFYGGNIQAQNSKGRLKTFEELASNSYLGILRMDVDSLGMIFIQGLSEKERNFAAYATLSFLLDYFFSGYLNTIREKYKDDVNILYSGGDDVFAVGYWKSLIQFAKDIRYEFKKFVGREDISISGGITFVGDKFPIAKAAALAGDAEKKAKEFDNGKKNAINIFGKNVSWENEFDYVESVKTKFVELHKSHEMPRSIFHKIMQLHNVMESGDLSYLWNTAYYLKRFSSGKKEEVSNYCLNILQKEMLNKRKFELITIAARWAELETKKQLIK